MPSCDKCAELKEELAKTSLKGVEIDAGEDEGVAEIRKIYPKIRNQIKRTEDGSFPFPTVLLLNDAGEIEAIAHNPEQLKEKLQ